MWDDIAAAFADLFSGDDDEMDAAQQEDPGTELDMDGDGFIDALGFDTDGDGSMDTFSMDANGDGLIDTMMDITSLDSDGDGIPDTILVNQGFDSDGDGIGDTFTTDEYHDGNGDGLAEYAVSFTGIDSDGDGVIDQLQICEDVDGDGFVDNIAGGAQLDAGSFDPFEMTDPMDTYVGGSAPAYENFDVADTYDPDVIGDPASAMDDWHWQETGSSCAVASQEFVLEELTGYEFEEAELREMAEDNGWYDPEGGTPMEDVGNILEAYGLNVEKSVGNDLEDLESALANGGEVIVGVDSGEIWYGEDDDLFLPGNDADHAVQVIGIDRSDPDNPMVILNDPGCSNGCGAMVPADLFMDAWEDSGCFMVEAYR